MEVIQTLQCIGLVEPTARLQTLENSSGLVLTHRRHAVVRPLQQRETNPMPHTIWMYFIELRKELLEAQKIRAQIIGFKVTFVSAATGLLLASSDIDRSVFAMPALAAICFDFLISSYSFSIKRIGSYVREHVEPALRRGGELPEGFVAWQGFLTNLKTRQNLAGYGNLGLTILAVAVAVWALVFPFRPVASSTLLLVLAVFAVMDILAYLEPRKLGKIWRDETTNTG